MTFHGRKYGRFRAIDGMHKLRKSLSSGCTSISELMPDAMKGADAARSASLTGAIQALRARCKDARHRTKILAGIAGNIESLLGDSRPATRGRDAAATPADNPQVGSPQSAGPTRAGRRPRLG